jgi:hypothetical protein
MVRESYMNYRQIFLLLVFPFLSGSLVAADITVNTDSLQGKWVKDDKKNCDTSAAEYVIFRGNGTMEAGRGAEPKSVGFWSVSQNIISLHMLVVPVEEDTTNVFYSGRYSYSYLSAEVLRATADVIEIITGTTGNTKRVTLAKCT